MYTREPSKNIEKIKQQEKDREDCINKIILLIPEYLNRYSDKDSYINWCGALLREWEYYLLMENQAINRRGVVRSGFLFYACFLKAKSNYFKKIGRREYANAVNTPPPQDELL